MTHDDKSFWQDAIAKSGSNLAASAYADLVAVIDSGKLDARSLRRFSTALRSIAQHAGMKASDLEDRAKRPWAYARE